MSARGAPRPTEIIHLPGPSWAPVFLALGIALALLGTFAGWVYSAIGGIFALPAIWAWARLSSREAGRLPPEQPLATAVLPPEPIRRRGRSE